MLHVLTFSVAIIDRLIKSSVFLSMGRQEISGYFHCGGDSHGIVEDTGLQTLVECPAWATQRRGRGSVRISPHYLVQLYPCCAVLSMLRMVLEHLRLSYEHHLLRTLRNRKGSGSANRSTGRRRDRDDL